MAKKGKWLRETQPAEPVSQAAREALTARLEQVEHYLPRAAHEGDVDSVHQVRVATRRATAAVDTYQDLLPSRPAKKIRKQLKRVRQAAGDARDYDVLLARLRRQSDEEPLATAWPMLLERICELRKTAQQPIREVQQKLKRKELAKRVEKLVRKIGWRDESVAEPTFGEAALARLHGVLDQFETASRSDLADLDQLHQFRIEGKRLRYAMELFAGVFPPPFKAELYPQVEDLQERLGAVTDHAAAADRFQAWHDSWDDSATAELLERLVTQERQAVDAAQRDFLAWWTAERRDDLLRQFVESLRASEAEQVA